MSLETFMFACLVGFLDRIEICLTALENMFGSIGYVIVYVYDRYKWYALPTQIICTSIGAAWSYLKIVDNTHQFWDRFWDLVPVFSLHIVLVLLIPPWLGLVLRKYYNIWTSRYPTLHTMSKSVGLIGVLTGFVSWSNLVGKSEPSYYTVSYSMFGYLHVVSVLKLGGFTDIYSATDGIMSINLTVFSSLKNVGWGVRFGYYFAACVLMIFKVAKLRLPKGNAGGIQINQGALLASQVELPIQDLTQAPGQPEVTAFEDLVLTSTQVPGQPEDTPVHISSEDPGQREDTLVQTSSEDSGQREDTPVQTSSEDPGQREDTPVQTSSEDPGQTEDTPVHTSSEDPGQPEDTPVQTSTQVPGQLEDTAVHTSSEDPDQPEDTPVHTSIQDPGQPEDTAVQPQFHPLCQSQVEDRQLDSSRVQTAMASIAASSEADPNAKRLREKELASVKINPAHVEIIVDELELEKSVVERALREHKGDAVAATRDLLSRYY